MLTSRTPLKVPLASCACGALVEIGQDDLRLSPRGAGGSVPRGEPSADPSEDEALGRGHPGLARRLPPVGMMRCLTPGPSR